MVGIVFGMAEEKNTTETAAVVTDCDRSPETATTEMDAVMEVVTATKNAIARGIVTVSATAVTPEDAIGMSVAVKQQETHRTEQ